MGLPDELQYTNEQLGQKFGKHMHDYPGLKHAEYLNKAQSVYQNANRIIRYPANAPLYRGETHFIYGNDLLRLDKNGFFRSLYPGAY